MTRGVIFFVSASVMFATIFALVTFMNPLPAQDVFAWRMTLTGPLVSLLITLTNEWPKVRAALQDVKRRPGVMGIYLLNAANIAGQMWVFIWAPLNGMALEASLGYFLMPLVMVIIGRFLYKESMSTWQVVATLFAAAGVLHEVFRVGSISWIVIFIAIGYPLIFVLRRSFKTSGQGGSWIELNLIFFIAFYLLVQADFNHDVLSLRLIGLLLLLAALTALSMIMYFNAGQLLPFSLFGLLGYLEPVLLVVVAFLLGERLAPRELFTYGPIWIAVLLLVIEGIRTMDLRNRRRISRSASA